MVVCISSFRSQKRINGGASGLNQNTMLLLLLFVSFHEFLQSACTVTSHFILLVGYNKNTMCHFIFQRNPFLFMYCPGFSDILSCIPAFCILSFFFFIGHTHPYLHPNVGDHRFLKFTATYIFSFGRSSLTCYCLLFSAQVAFM